MNDEELDKLFRDAASRFQPPDAPEGAWDEFYKTKMLPAEKNTKTRRFFIPRRSWQLAAACLLLVVTGLVWMLQQRTVSGPGEGPSNTETTLGRSEKAPVPSGADQLPPAKAPGNNGNEDRSLNTGQPGMATILFEHKEQPLANKGRTFFDGPQKGEIQPGHQPADTAKQQRPYFSLRDKPADERPSRPALPGYYNPSGTDAAPGRRTALGQWQVGLLAGSNLGMVRGDISKKPGLNAGLLVQKKLGGTRFSLESGVIYESMTYAVNNEDFNPNGSPVSSKVSNIEGSCTMIDVPVNVRYDVVASRKNKAFISTGVSPTVIVKQSYIYDFDRGEGPVPVTRDVSGRGKSVYAVANLSVGYEQKWSTYRYR